MDDICFVSPETTATTLWGSGGFSSDGDIHPKEKAIISIQVLHIDIYIYIYIYIYTHVYIYISYIILLVT